MRAVIAGIALAASVALGWRWLLAAPLIGGPLAALAAGLLGWRLASAFAPLPHANDNARRTATPSRR